MIEVVYSVYGKPIADLLVVNFVDNIVQDYFKNKRKILISTSSEEVIHAFRLAFVKGTLTRDDLCFKHYINGKEHFLPLTDDGNLNNWNMGFADNSNYIVGRMFREFALKTFKHINPS